MALIIAQRICCFPCEQFFPGVANKIAVEKEILTGFGDAPLAY
jgi:hypothetical protein